MIFSVTAEEYSMTAQVEIIGLDLLITITGGNSPHIGTVTTLTKNTEIKTIRYPSHDNRLHKDDILALTVAGIIQKDLLGSCTITSGVHVDHISKKQILASEKMARNLGEQIDEWLINNPIKIPKPIYYSDQEQPE